MEFTKGDVMVHNGSELSFVIDVKDKKMSSSTFSGTKRSGTQKVD